MTACLFVLRKEKKGIILTYSHCFFFLFLCFVLSRLDSDVPVSYFISRDMYAGPQALPEQPKTARAPIAVFVSNCKGKWVSSERGKFIRELMRHIDVDSYGACFRNAHLPAALRHEPWWKAKWNVSSNYHFTLAFEVIFVDEISKFFKILFVFFKKKKKRKSKLNFFLKKMLGFSSEFC